MKHTVIITGGTKGLGREIALAFGRAGCFVTAFYATDKAAAESLRDAFETEKISGIALQHDVTAENAEMWRRPEIMEAERLTLIHAACAPFTPAPMHQLHWPDFQNSFEVAVKGGWLCAQSLICPMLKTGGGTIVNVLTSAVEAMPPKSLLLLCDSKTCVARPDTFARGRIRPARGPCVQCFAWFHGNTAHPKMGPAPA